MQGSFCANTVQEEAGLKKGVENLVTSFTMDSVWQGCNLPSDKEFQQAVKVDHLPSNNSFEALASLTQFEGFSMRLWIVQNLLTLEDWVRVLSSLKLGLKTCSLLIMQL
ncbi:unnamed protein product [Linum tenue]|uniref:Uncharacterized protein n=1 Tax=Linum tenue TaxID=586396 RepID=A0AAV0I9K2_9ROSI|nr:unnamed protein product [Linum tenue]